MLMEVISYTFNFRFFMHKKILISFVVCVLTLCWLEVYLHRVYIPEPAELKFYSGEPLVRALTKTPISGREIGNQMLIHNVALFDKYPKKNSVTRAYIGTSRSKVIRPEWYGISGAVNASGNSYNEISFGLLLQADLLKIQFPELKTIFVETSLLLRRPNRLIVEEDHVKYLGQLKTLNDLKLQLKDSSDFVKSVDSKFLVKPSIWSNIYLLSHGGELKISNFLKKNKEEMFPTDEPYIKTLLADGERPSIPKLIREEKNWLPSISESHIKVQRLRDIESWYPWDGLFDLFVIWGKKNNVQIVFYQPPVRSDLYEYQKKYGLQMHIDDIARISKENNIPFINLNTPEAGFGKDWSLFEDEDHLETCLGFTYLTAALEIGFSKFNLDHTLLPLIDVDLAKEKARPQIEKCSVQ
jgi:hypothetical protein